MNLKDKAQASGIFTVVIKRNGKIIDKFDSTNIVVDEGLNHMHNATFKGATQKATWYIGLYGNNYTPVAGATGITIAAASGELTTQYSEASRQTWNSVVADNVIDNDASPATFTMAADDTIYGAFLVSESTKGGAVAGTILMGASLFSSGSRTVLTGDEVVIKYKVTLTSS